MTSADTIARSLEQNRPKVFKKDYTFYNLDFIQRLAKASEKEGCRCKRCQDNMERLAVLSDTFPELIEMGSSGKQTLENGMDGIFSHLKDEHGYVRAGWYKPLYGVWGMAAGIAIGTLLALAVPDENARVAFLSAAIALLLAGYWLGARKDSTCEQEGKAL